MFLRNRPRLFIFFIFLEDKENDYIELLLTKADTIGFLLRFISEFISGFIYYLNNFTT